MKKLLTTTILLLMAVTCYAVSYMNHGDGTSASTVSSYDTAFSGSRVRNSANISIASSSYVALTFDTEDTDTDGYHESITNPSRLTITDVGSYNATCAVRWDNNSTGYRQIFIKLNGTTYYGEGTTELSVNGRAQHTSFFSAPLVSGDYIECFVYQSSGDALNVLYGAGYSPRFEIEKAGDQ